MKNFLITGTPSVGKTTLIKKIAGSLPADLYQGFFSEEIRKDGKRVGFAIETFDGVRKILSHVDFVSQYRVAKYCVDVSALNEILDHIATLKMKPRLFLVDEIGKMESLSPKFREWIELILAGSIPVTATISLGGNPWINSLKDYPNTQIFKLIPENRESLFHQLCQIIGEQIGL